MASVEAVAVSAVGARVAEVVSVAAPAALVEVQVASEEALLAGVVQQVAEVVVVAGSGRLVECCFSIGGWTA